MTATSLPAGAPAGLNLEDIPQRSVDVWMRTIQPYAGIFAILAAPAALLAMLFMPHGAAKHTLWPFGIITLVSVVLDVIAFMIVLPGCMDEVHAQPRPARDLVALARQRLVPLASTAACVGIAVGAGLAVYVAPGAILAMLLCMALPVCAVEALGPAASLRRSVNLTEGNRGLLFIILFAMVVLGIIAGTVAGIGIWVLGRYVGVLAQVAVNAAFGVLVTSVAVVVYSDLKALHPAPAPASDAVADAPASAEPTEEAEARALDGA